VSAVGLVALLAKSGFEERARVAWAAPPAVAKVVAAGDIASCASGDDEATVGEIGHRVAADSTTFSVVVLVLKPRGDDLRFASAADRTFRDSLTRAPCHGAHLPPPRPVAGRSQAGFAGDRDG
jgi:hypothetical protein